MKRRQGFTIVELLVSMALIVFIMAILSQAFSAALNTFRNLKAEGDMAEKLRAVTQLLQRDLAADHFEGKKRLSNPNFWSKGPPSQGYFRIWQGSTGTSEGTDSDGFPSYTTHDHYLSFTVKKRGNDMGNFFSANAPAPLLAASQFFGPVESRYQNTSGGSYNYQWAEVTWFLQPSINPITNQPDMTVADPLAGSTAANLYTLYRRQRLLVPDNAAVQLQSAGAYAYGSVAQYNLAYANCLEMSCWDSPATLYPPGTTPGNLYFNSPIDITAPARRFGMASTNPAGMLYGVPSTLNPAGLWPLEPAPLMVPPYVGSWFPPNLAGTPPFLPPPAPYALPLIPYYPTLAQQGAGGTLAGADIQLNDVISFDVRVLPMYPVGTVPSIAEPFLTLFDMQNLAPFNVIFPNSNPAFYIPANNVFKMTPNLLGAAVFDTWSSLNDSLGNYSTWYTASQTTTLPNWNATPLSYLYPVGNNVGQKVTVTGSGPIIMALQISIRIWDYKTNQSRQVTMVQAM